MKNQKINYKHKFFCLLFFLSTTFGAMGQKIIMEEGSIYIKDTFSEDSLKSRYMFDSGSKKHRLEEIMMPVERYSAGSLSAKSETIKSDDEWNIHRVHRGKYFSGMSDRSIALDANGKPHIAYGQTHLYYAWYDEEWHIETVDDSWDVGWFASLALDSDGYPHISYYDRDPNGDLKYAYKNENGWHIATIDDDGDDGSVGWFTSIALDENNQPHISYHDGTNGNLKYAYWDGSEWLIQTIDSEGVVGYWRTSLAIGPNNFPHISYYDETNGNLKYTHWDGSDWQIVTVDNDDDVGGYSSLAMDENGYPHISYLDYASARLKYAFWNGSEWQHATVDEGGDSDVGWYNSIALDTVGNPHIGYCDWSGKNLKYAFFNGSDWEVQRVTPSDILMGASEGYYASMALDTNGRPHISHAGEKRLAYERFGLRYTYYDGSEWQRDVVDYELEFSHTSLAVDSTSNPHIGYIKSDQAMGYTRWDGNQWHYESLNPGGNIVNYRGGSGSFLSLDADQRPHIIIQEMKNHLWLYMPSFPILIYTWYDDIWHKKNLYYSSFDYQRRILSSSIIIDDLYNPHICFYGYSSNNTFPYTSPTFLRYMFRENNEWFESEIIKYWSAITVRHHSFVIESVGLPRVIYTDSGLRYARPGESDWDIQLISDDWGSYNSIKTDTNDLPHISFMGFDSLQNNTALKYAHWDGSEWQIEIVDNNGDVGKYTSLAIDANEYPHISYYDETNGNLKYAYWDGSQWQIETVDSYRTVGLYTSLALDANGDPHISYYDASFGDLKYASKRPLESILTIVASAGNNGSIVPSGEVEVEYKNDQVFAITPDEGFSIAFIRVDESDIELAMDENWDAENGEYTFSNVTEDHTIEAGFEDATSISNVKKDEIKVYPNPTSNKLWIEFYHQGNEKLVIVLQNQQGQTVRQVYVDQTGLLRVSMPTQKLASGIYLLTIQGKKAFPVKKVMIEN